MLKSRNLCTSLLSCLYRMFQKPPSSEVPRGQQIPDSWFTEIHEHRPVPPDCGLSGHPDGCPRCSLPSPSGLLQGILSSCFCSPSFPSFLIPQAPLLVKGQRLQFTWLGSLLSSSTSISVCGSSPVRMLSALSSLDACSPATAYYSSFPTLAPATSIAPRSRTVRSPQQSE